MTVFLRNLLAIVIGLALGSAVNMGLVIVGPAIIAPPPGVDVTDPVSLGESMHLFEARHFVFPFLAHALGTLVGALAAFVAAASHRTACAYAIGVVFFAGGIWASFAIPAPGWFVTLDLVAAYFPMAWAGRRLAEHFVPRP